MKIFGYYIRLMHSHLLAEPFEQKYIMNTYHGSCHCSRVKFEVTTVIDKVVACNCSICTKKGVLHHRVTPEQFSLVEDKNT